MGPNLFAESDHNLSVPRRVRNSLRHINLDSPHVTRLRAALEISGLKYEIPGWIVQASNPVHATIPSHKVAVRIVTAPVAKLVKCYKEEWEAAGWHYVGIWQADIASFEPEALARQLKEYLGTLKVKSSRK